MLIEGMLLNDIRNPIKNGDFKCKATLKLHQKQFNILTSEYLKFLTYNNPSFAITSSAEVCLEITFAKINSAIFLFQWPLFRKNKLLPHLIPSK